MSGLQPAPASLEAAAKVLREGGLVIYPTEAVHGIGCDPGNPAALERLLEAKRRPASKGMILIAAEVDQLAGWMGEMPADCRARMLASWPGPHTWIVPAAPTVDPLLRGEHAGIAVRVTAHPVAAALCRAFGGAIVSTSANLSGRPTARDLDELRAQFGDSIDYYLDGPLGGRDRPSEIRDALSGAVLRP